jgi:N utilization substance protein A
MRVDVNEDKSSVVAIVPDRQLSLAIGKDGQNARLAAKLTGLNVDIKSDVEVDTKTPVKAGAAPTAEEAAEAVAPAAEETTAEEAIEAPAAELVEAEAPAEAPAVEPVQPSEEPVEPVAAEIPKELLLPEEVPSVPKPVPAGDVGAPIQELPDEIWRVRQPVAAQPGVIRFAEDIAELDRGAGGRRGRRGGGGRSRKTRTTRRR